MRCACYRLLFITLLLSIFALSAHSKSKDDLELRADNWVLNGDGRWVVIVRGINSQKHVDFHASSGTIIPIPEWVFNNPNVVKIVTSTPEPLTVTAGSKSITIASPQAILQASPFQLTLVAVGPHMVSLGFSFFDKTHVAQQYQIWRGEDNGEQSIIATVDGSVSTYKDNTVAAKTNYQYKVVALQQGQPVANVSLSIKTPAPMIKKSLDALTGKGAVIYIDPDSRSSFYYKTLKPEKIIADCQLLGFRYIQLRTVYGAYSHFIDPDMMNWLTQLLDLAKSQHIYVIAWSVPRYDSIESISEDITVAAYVTPNGSTFAGSSIDLETGSGYMGNLSVAKDKMVNFVKYYRQAVGPDYLLVAIVFTPTSTGYNNSTYPYQAIAQYADVMQPMTYWHHYFTSTKHVYDATEVSHAIVNSIQMTQQLAGRNIPINVMGQSIDIGDTGIPSQMEIEAALTAAKSASAIGVSFFAWTPQLIPSSGNLSEQAQAIQNFTW